MVKSMALFGRKKKKTEPPKKAAAPANKAAASASGGETLAAQAAQRAEMIPADSAILYLAQTAGLPRAVWESDIYEGEEKPFCYKDFEKVAVEHLDASRKKLEQGLGLDARAEVWVSSDRLEAWAAVFPPSNGGLAVTPDLVTDALAKRKVSSGINEQAVEQLKTPEGYLKMFRVAAGTPPQDGRNGEVISLIEELDPRWKTDSKGKINFADRDWILNVDEGQKLCEIIHPTEGVAGLDVMGKELRAKNGKPVPKINGKNTSFTEDGKYLVADGAGQLIQTGGKYLVNEVLTIKGDVDYSTGNIKSNSTVVIHGGVKPNFVVESKQDVIIQGSVEWATIIAGHDISVTGGVTAGPDDYLQAGNDIRCRFMENGRAFCKGDAYFENLVLSDVRAEGSVFVTSGRGSVIAGSVTAMGEINVTTVGNRSYRATELRIAQTPRFRERLERCAKDLEAARESVRVGNANISRLVANQGNAQVRAALQSQRGMLSIANTKLENLQRRYEELSMKAESVMRGKISVDTGHPNVTIAIGDESLVLQNEVRYATFILRNHEIEMVSQT